MCEIWNCTVACYNYAVFSLHFRSVAVKPNITWLSFCGSVKHKSGVCLPAERGHPQTTAASGSRLASRSCNPNLRAFLWGTGHQCCRASFWARAASCSSAGACRPCACLPSSRWPPCQGSSLLPRQLFIQWIQWGGCSGPAKGTSGHWSLWFILWRDGNPVGPATTPGFPLPEAWPQETAGPGGERALSHPHLPGWLPQWLLSFPLLSWSLSIHHGLTGAAQQSTCSCLIYPARCWTNKLLHRP